MLLVVPLPPLVHITLLVLEGTTKTQQNHFSDRFTIPRKTLQCSSSTPGTQQGRHDRELITRQKSSHSLAAALGLRQNKSPGSFDICQFRAANPKVVELRPAAVFCTHKRDIVTPVFGGHYVCGGTRLDMVHSTL